jgi:hypothetical protein
VAVDPAIPVHFIQPRVTNVITAILKGTGEEMVVVMTIDDRRIFEF